MIRAARELSHHSSKAVSLGVVAVLAAVVIGAGWQYARAAGAKAGSLGRLARIAGETRVTRGRLSGGFDYVACQSDSSRDRLVNGLVCDSTNASLSSAERLGEFAEELRGGRRGSATRDAHAAGVWHLLSGRADEAVAELRDAVRRDPLNAGTLNDLAVALTAYAQRHDDPSVLVDAFVASDSAVRADSTLKEARFTHALLLEKLYLRLDATTDWTRYLRLDRRSRWATEARAHLVALERPWPSAKEELQRLQRAAADADSQTLKAIISADPASARTEVQRALGRWGKSYAAGEPDSRSPLRFARVVSDWLKTLTGDALFADDVAAIDRALAEDSSRAKLLADGHANLATAIDSIGKLKYAKPLLAAATTALARGKTPMSQWASLYVARAKLGTAQDTAMKSLTAIRDSSPTRYIALRSSAAQYQGFLYDVHSEYMQMLAAYDSALSENEAIRDPQISIRVGAWAAQAQGVLRGREAGWRARYAALSQSPHYLTSYASLYSAFDYSTIATLNDAPRLALRYADESIRLAHKTDSINLAYALRRRAEVLASIGEIDRARADAANAVEVATKLSPNDPSKLIADVTLASARIAMRSSPAEAEKELRRVVDVYKKYEKGLPMAYVSLAQARAAAGALDSARVALDSATALLQRQRSSVTGYAERGAFLDGARAVIDQGAAFHAKRDARTAFEYFESTRARVLMDQLAAQGAAVVDQHDVIGQLQRRLSKDDAVISYAVLPQELLIWTITRDRFEQHQVPVASAQLQDLVARFQQSLTQGEPDTAASGRLYQLLIDSASAQLGSTLIVIPDRWLHFVPFVALRNPASGRLLLRDRIVSYAPSAAWLLLNLSRRQQRFSQTSRVLAIGNPAFDRREFPLRNLPAAEGEAVRIAGLYADQSPLTGPSATHSALRRLAPQFDILHFAGHAVVGRDAPELSHLVLASDQEANGAVFSTEIAQWKLPRTRLVILSGCNTADGKLSATEGAASLARAFFAAGVPAVISSLWEIDDDATADFFISFHRLLVQGVSPAVALHEAQIKAAAAGRAPVRAWAAFQLFGG